MRYFVRTPSFIRWIYPTLIWEMPPGENEIFLTFDDGPDPSTTPQILEILKRFDAKATFFCTGKRAAKHPDLMNLILAEGHKVGQHTYNHLNGWKTPDNEYFSDIEKCSKVIDSKLLRPPYGRISKSQIRHLGKQYKIVMWSVLPGDFDSKASPEDCLDNAIRYSEPGSIVVLHDNPRFSESTLFALPRLLDHFSGKGYRFKNIYL